MTDTQFINSLIHAAESYQNNLTYNPTPTKGAGTYNSNGYISGIVNSIGARLPQLPFWQPGVDVPIPLPASHVNGSCQHSNLK